MNYLEDLKQVTYNLYRSISFKKDEKPDLKTLKSLFISESKLVHHNSDDPVIMSVDEFINRYTENINNGSISEFTEYEIFEKTDCFGYIAQRFSVYEAKISIGNESNLSKGINSIQFINKDYEWKVLSILWMDENSKYKIPAEYLNK